MKCTNCGSPLRGGAKFCGKCGHQISTVQNRRTPVYGTNTDKYISKKSKRRKISLIKFITTMALVIVLMIGLLFFMQRTNPFNTEKNAPIELSQVNLSELNQNCITTEQVNISMQNEIEGTALIKVRIPDYTELFQAAIQSENPDQYVAAALASGEITLIETEVSARVTVENGEQIIHTEEAIKKLIAKELSKAITAVMEEQ